MWGQESPNNNEQDEIDMLYQVVGFLPFLFLEDEVNTIMSEKWGKALSDTL